jgi:transcriptional regulator of acetoin/glycerol metabolism
MNELYEVLSPGPMRVLALCLGPGAAGEWLMQACQAAGIGTMRMHTSKVLAWLRQSSANRVVLDEASWQAAPQLQAWACRSDRDGAVCVVSGLAVEQAAQESTWVHRVGSPACLDDAMRIVNGLVLPQAAMSTHAPQQQGPGLEPDDPAALLVEQVAPLPVDLLITGETGTGKDHLARYLHQRFSPSGPYVPVNCAAIPETLAEAELFGYEAGAFTGAQRARPGRIEDADGGVLYLDEIDSCPLWLQAKLLRCLQDKGAVRVGSSTLRGSNFRLIASTKRPLQELVAEGRFRSDLLYRLQIVDLVLQPLRLQPVRLLRLFDQMVDDVARCLGTQARCTDLRVQAQLLAHDWPGNLRELRAAATRHVLGLPCLAGAGAPPVQATGLRAAIDACEKGLLEACLRRWRGNLVLASNELKLPRTSLHYRLKRLHIESPPAAAQVAATSGRGFEI